MLWPPITNTPYPLNRLKLYWNQPFEQNKHTVIILWLPYILVIKNFMTPLFFFPKIYDHPVYLGPPLSYHINISLSLCGHNIFVAEMGGSQFYRPQPPYVYYFHIVYLSLAKKQTNKQTNKNQEWFSWNIFQDTNPNVNLHAEPIFVIFLFSGWLTITKSCEIGLALKFPFEVINAKPCHQMNPHFLAGGS